MGRGSNQIIIVPYKYRIYWTVKLLHIYLIAMKIPESKHEMIIQQNFPTTIFICQKYTTKYVGMVIDKIEKNDDFWNKIEPRLKNFS